MTRKGRDLAGAVADGAAVDWAAVRSGGEGHDPAVANLELLDRIATASGAKALRGHESGRIRLSGVLAPWEAGLLLVAVVRSLLAIVGTLWFLPATGRDLLLTQLAVSASCLIGGLILIRGGEGDRRAVALAGILLTSAGATSWPHYLRLFARTDSASFDPLIVVLPEALFAYWIWTFVSVFPRRVVAGFGDSLFVVGRKASLAWGLLLLCSHAAVTLIPALRPSLHVFARTGTNFWFWGVIGLLTLIAFPMMILAAWRAESGERRRTALFLAAIVVGFGPIFCVEVADGVLGQPQRSSFGLALELLPCLTFPFTTAYGILVKRVLPVRALLHEATRYLLARVTLGLVLGLPILVITLALIVRRDRPIAEALDGGLLGTLAGVGLILAPVAVYRRHLLGRLDRLFNRDPQDWHGHLAQLTRSLATATTIQDALAALDVNVARPLGTDSVEVWRVSLDHRFLAPSRAGARPVEVTSGPVLLAFDSAEPLIVDPADEDSAFWWLPETDRQWLIEANAGLLSPMTIGEKPTGLLVLGPRRGSRVYEKEELQFLAASAATTAAAIDRFAVEPLRVQGPAQECLACGCVLDPGANCACGGQVVESRLPRMLAGRYEVERCIGQGAMGKVYSAMDSDLGRAVALKTLPAASSEESIRLRQEARAMASLSHPNLAVLYGIETWNGAPVLVQELMTGGTLADRLTAPLEIDEVVRLGVAIAAALEALHAASFVHHDVKPSNIGYSDRGEPKLLDLGLADAGTRSKSTRLTRDGDSQSRPSFAGTPRYAPPEAWRGERVGFDGDLWALAMVLYECITASHPLARIEPEDWSAALRGLPRPDSLRPECPTWLSDIVAQGLSTMPAARWHFGDEIHVTLGNHR